MLSLVKKFLDGANCVFFNLKAFESVEKFNVKWLTDDQQKVCGSASFCHKTLIHTLKISLVHNKTNVEFLQLLLHEMCHMLVQKCKQREMTEGRQILQKLIGKSGHGFHWQQLARAVEYRAREVLRPQITLERLQSVVVEWHDSGVEPGLDYLDIIYWNEWDEGILRARIARERAKQAYKKWFANGGVIVEEFEVPMKLGMDGKWHHGQELLMYFARPKEDC